MTAALAQVLGYGAATEAALFWAFALLAVGSAVGIVVSRNIVRTAVLLLGTLGAAAGLYFLLAAEFLAAVQLVVYAGGTLILIIFGVMLTSKSPFSRYQPRPAEVVVAVAVGLVLLVALGVGIAQGTSRTASVTLRELPSFVTLPADVPVKHDVHTQTLTFEGRMTPAQRDALLAPVSVGRGTETVRAQLYREAVARLYDRSQKTFASQRLELPGSYPMAELGVVLLGDFLIPFEVASVLLLVVMIGAAYLAKARKRRAEAGSR